ncbi:MAG TPA: T9SS type A sorting domain-containing protein, partial [Ignavibacteria bacterium]|nr:T9SS type A sorting domain-containing protein [Ignavibacteria bacterium]
RLQNSVTGVRSVYLLDNGRYLVTNGSGVHEVDSSSGALLRTVVAGLNFQYITLYKPDLVVSAENNNTFLSDRFVLSQNYPNPFNPITKINYELRNTNYVSLKVYDVLGNEVRKLVNEKQNQGNYEIEFDGTGLSSGIYYYSIEAGNFKQTRKMILVK